MKSDLAVFFFSFFTLVFCAAAEDLSPRLFGVAPPVVMAASIVFSPRTRSSWAQAMLFAAAAGAIEDALCSLPPATSASFFSLCTFIVRRFHVPMAFVPVAFPLYLVWLRLWGLVPGGITMHAFVMFSFLGFVLTPVLSAVVGSLASKAGVE